jgi:hypothetical protein
MSLLSVEEKIELLKNLLADPNDWVSEQILRLNEQAEENKRSEASEVNSPSGSPK